MKGSEGGGYREASCASVSLYDARGRAALDAAHGAHARGEEGDAEDDGGRWRSRRCCDKRPGRLLRAHGQDCRPCGRKDKLDVPSAKSLPKGVRAASTSGKCGRAGSRTPSMPPMVADDAKERSAHLREVRGIDLRHETGGVGTQVIRALRQAALAASGQRVASRKRLATSATINTAWAITENCEGPRLAHRLRCGRGRQCKTLVTERLKRSGMRWSVRGGQAILTLRAWLQSQSPSTQHGPFADRTPSSQRSLRPQQCSMPLRRRTRIH